MDPSRSASHPFSRPQSHQMIPDTRFPPIPPSPYTTQPAAPRPDTLHMNDPFLRRRKEHEARPINSPTQNHAQAYAVHKPSQYPPSTLSDFSDPVPRDATGQRGRQGLEIKYDNGRGEQFANRLTEASSSSSASDPKQPPNSQIQLHKNIPPPPNPPYAYRAFQMPKADQARRRQDSPQRSFDDHPPPPPPPFSGRQMPPPSPPQISSAQTAARSIHPRGPPPPSPFSSSRDNGLPTVNRTESTMSISSMLGSDAGRDDGRPSREPTSTITTNNPSPLRGNARPSPIPQSGSASTTPQAQYQRSQSPERTSTSLAQSTYPSRALSGGFSRRQFTTTSRNSPPRLGSASSLFPSQYSPASDAGSQTEWRTSQDRRISTERPMERPNSQPSGYRTPPLELEHKLYSRPMTSEIEGLLNKNSPAREQHMVGNNLDRQILHLNEKPKSQLYTHDSSNQKSSNPSAYPFLNKAPSASESQHPQTRLRTEPSSSRFLERENFAPSQPPYSPETLRRVREERLATGLHQQNSSLSPTNIQPRVVEKANEHQGVALPRNPSSIIPGIENVNVAEGVDQPQNHRASLALHIDNSRRGRVSPLPQAVQGAQGRLSGPASDPGIKNEFAKMFMGIGAGVGRGGRLGSGTSSPFPSSPTKNLEAERRSPFARRGDLTEVAKPRSTSRGGRRGRKAKDDDLKPDSEAAESPNTVGTTNTRGMKRSRHSHHHHPHQHSHHHHHHLHDESVVLNGTPRSNSTNSRRMGTNLQPGPNSGAVAGHHHHHHHHHYHHHNPKGTATPAVLPPRIPTTIINNRSVLDSVRKSPRHHLGSTLYRPWVEPDTAMFLAPGLSDPRPPNLIPRFRGKANCTFTIRVPRFHLTDTEREEICRRRAIWGVDVYTDDSDPVAAAIHAGWICGEWGEGVDLSMLDPNYANAPKTEPSRRTASAQANLILTNPPSVPMQPVSGKDLHINILILPALQRYTSCTRYGIKSRSWGDSHDGMSFMIEKITWIDEGAGNGEERNGEARRKRMKNMAAGQGATTGPPLRLNVMKKPGSGTDVAAVGA